MKPEFNKVLCKRTLDSGKSFYWDDSLPPVRIEFDNRILVKGDLYDIVEKNDIGFHIINNQKNRHHFNAYSDDDKNNFPENFDVYGPRDYSKWFYTPEEMEAIELGTYKQSFKDKHAISVFIGNYHWVKQTEARGGGWIIALCHQKHNVHGKHYWKTFSHIGADMSDFDFADIGHQVDSMKTQEENKEKLEDHSELNSTIFPLLDSLKYEGTEEENKYAPVAYHRPLLRDALVKYFSKSFGRIKNSDLFF